MSESFTDRRPLMLFLALKFLVPTDSCSRDGWLWEKKIGKNLNLFILRGRFKNKRLPPPLLLPPDDVNNNKIVNKRRQDALPVGG